MYDIRILDTPSKELRLLDKSIAKRIIEKIYWLRDNFDMHKPESLKGEFSTFYKLRIGEYRVLYQVDSSNKEIIIHLIGHRKEIYK